MNKAQQHSTRAIVNLKTSHTSQTSVHSINAFADQGYLNTEDCPQLEQVAERFSVAITPQMLDLIDPANPNDPIAKQFVPNVLELQNHNDELRDPIGDTQHSPVTGIVHRYPDRLLLTPVRVCPVYCRFCFRREHVGNNADAMLSSDELQAALNYIREHDEVWEVILSGGDPLLMSPRRLQEIVTALENIRHVKVIRIHTRVPVVDPTRISRQLIKVLKCSKAVYVVLHSNHPNELSANAQKACAMLVENGIPMLSQTVLLKGINDNPVTLEALMRTLVENRIKPYYLHHADRARGTSHFRTTIKEGQELLRELHGKVSGLCQPEYVLDIPGGAGKVPIGPNWLTANNDNGYTATDYNGCQHDYKDQYTDTCKTTLD
ncbi:MAG: lysine-2,3-aminomutase-like protein [Gammaproteobacteria bacterium]|nr:lysine-2,3-aminomutase-like protein [Gammaproteobacteria bacterium]MCP4089264.1 lysine-2,3-aminomutase-like protein [Gammaproteobacteria bacterium]MCP4275312.1 lysine-2,3-aminomutase-like protein [Gammaproteobacteria bacterium]MCP4830904.1 lysine-2,3-aminomutase-like protein [Gammaproteobacteria bacterium]MCP4929521.1 lysine-2,3-aminomutase-like protein [Gammaproteobacteria bacterium]